MLHVLTGAAVELIEIDPTAAGLAADLCLRLAAGGVLRPEAVTVHQADASGIDPARYALVVTASLLPGLTHHGAVVPLTSVSLAPDPPPGCGAVPIGSPRLLAVAPAAVLNRTELFS